MLGFFDIFAALILFIGDTWLQGFLLFFMVGFLLFKGVTSVFKIPIWVGPISFVAGFPDLIVGLTLYFSAGYAGVFSHVADVTGVFMTLKGGMTLVFGLLAR